MGDLVITLPQTIKWPEYQRELAAVADGQAVMNFRVPSQPKRAGAGDRCYLIHNGTLQGYMLIHDVVYRDGFTCDTTGTVWREGWYVQRTGTFYTVQQMISMRGFQGYRYAPETWRTAHFTAGTLSKIRLNPDTLGHHVLSLLRTPEGDGAMLAKLQVCLLPSMAPGNAEDVLNLLIGWEFVDCHDSRYRLTDAGRSELERLNETRALIC